MAKSIKLKNNTYIDTSGISHNKQVFKTKFQEKIMNVAPSMSEGKWQKLCNIKLDSLVQGEFIYMRIFIGDGNNGRPNQNAYIELTMQTAWSGSNEGKAGCYAILHSLGSPFTTASAKIKIIYNSSDLSYDVWFFTEGTYTRPCYTVDASDRVVTTPKWEKHTTEPTGDICQLTYVSA